MLPPRLPLEKPTDRNLSFFTCVVFSLEAIQRVVLLSHYSFINSLPVFELQKPVAGMASL